MTLATAGFERYAKRTRRATFLAEMERVVPWPALCALIEPFYPKPVMAARRSGSSGCCASISCSTGSICRTRRWRRRFTIRRRCGVLWTSISAASRCPTKPRCGDAGRFPRDRWFESGFLQRRVCELSVPLETKSIRDLPRYGPSLRPPTKINARGGCRIGASLFCGPPPRLHNYISRAKSAIQPVPAHG